MSYRFGSQTPGASKKTTYGAVNSQRLFEETFDDFGQDENDLDDSKTYIFRLRHRFFDSSYRLHHSSRCLAPHSIATSFSQFSFQSEEVHW